MLQRVLTIQGLMKIYHLFNYGQTQCKLPFSFFNKHQKFVNFRQVFYFILLGTAKNQLNICTIKFVKKYLTRILLYICRRPIKVCKLARLRLIWRYLKVYWKKLLYSQTSSKIFKKSIVKELLQKSKIKKNKRNLERKYFGLSHIITLILKFQNC